MPSAARSPADKPADRSGPDVAAEQPRDEHEDKEPARVDVDVDAEDASNAHAPDNYILWVLLLGRANTSKQGLRGGIDEFASIEGTPIRLLETTNDRSAAKLCPGQNRSSPVCKAVKPFQHRTLSIGAIFSSSTTRSFLKQVDALGRPWRMRCLTCPKPWSVRQRCRNITRLRVAISFAGAL